MPVQTGLTAGPQGQSGPSRTKRVLDVIHRPPLPPLVTRHSSLTPSYLAILQADISDDISRATGTQGHESRSSRRTEASNTKFRDGAGLLSQGDQRMKTSAMDDGPEKQTLEKRVSFMGNVMVDGTGSCREDDRSRRQAGWLVAGQRLVVVMSSCCTAFSVRGHGRAHAHMPVESSEAIRRICLIR